MIKRLEKHGLAIHVSQGMTDKQNVHIGTIHFQRCPPDSDLVPEGLRVQQRSSLASFRRLIYTIWR